MKVPVYDGRNQERLLGYFVDPPVFPGRYYRVAAADLAYAYRPVGPFPEISFKEVTFERGMKPAPDEWVTRHVLITDDDLETLLLMGMKFRLPGETAEEQCARVEYKRYLSSR